MSVEIIGALVIMAAATLTVLATRLASPRRRRIALPPAVLSPADQHLLPYLKLTPAQWLSLSDFQRADLRQQAYRAMN